MNDKKLLEFIEWLSNNSESFADLDVEATIAQINKLASSDEGKETLEQLTKQYKSKEMELFKKGGKLDYLLCLKKGGKVQDCGCGKKLKAEDGTQLPRYAKIIEGGGPYAEERTIYYSDSPNDFKVNDGRLVSLEEVVNPWGYWNNEITRSGRPFGLNLEEVPVEYRAPEYYRYIAHPDGLNFQSALDIDKNKAAKETSDKIKKIRKQK